MNKNEIEMDNICLTKNELELIKKFSETHLIINKTNFACLICYEFSNNLYETGCCGNLLCFFCTSNIDKENCPICRIPTKFTPSKVLNKMIKNSFEKCQLCDYFDTSYLIPAHIKKEHLNELSDINIIKENKTVFNYLVSMYNLQHEKKAIIHDHSLKLVFRPQEDKIECFFCKLTYDFNCKMLKNSEEEKIKEEENIIINEENIIITEEEENIIIEPLEVQQIDNTSSTSLLLDEKENKINVSNKNINCTENKTSFLSNFYYKCDNCNFNYCLNCIEIKKMFLKSKSHIHPLELNFNNNGWSCDGRQMEDGCKSGITTFYQTDGMLRYQCRGCNFDLCEKCMFHYL